MWFSTNDRIENGNDFFLDLIPKWKDSASTNPKALYLFKGGYLQHLSDSLQMWADKDVALLNLILPGLTLPVKKRKGYTCNQKLKR